MNKYDDMLSLPHHVSAVHTPMPRQNRAVQFAPFAALSGYDAAVEEAARLTEAHKEKDEETISKINAALLNLLPLLPSRPWVRVLYFQADEQKAGGAYLEKTAQLRAIDPLSQALVFQDRSVLSFDDIYEISFASAP